MGAKVKIIIVLILMSAMWLSLLLKLGIAHATVTPQEGHLSLTFEGWATNPVSSHLFLAQTKHDDFANGRVYISGTYPFVFANFLLLAPFHFLFGLPYNIAHNFLPYYYVFGLVLLLVLATWRQLSAIFKKKRFLLWFLVFISIGISITDPLPWTSSFNAARDNPHILAAGLFCYLSTWVFYGQIPKTPLLVVGILLAVFMTMYIPAWILAGLFFQPTLSIDRKWMRQVLAVCALAVANVALPAVVCRFAGVTPTGSGFLYRSGLDGSTEYMTSIFQAVYSPNDLRHWPTSAYVLLCALLAICFHFFFNERNRSHPLRQTVFLLLPYATVAILLPQLTSIHPYTTDLFLIVPATFLMSFWFLQKRFWNRLTGNTYVVWLLVASFILMTNLLTVAQMPRFVYVQQNVLPAVSIIAVVCLALYLTLRFWKSHRQPRV